MTCVECGARFAADALVCPACGTEMTGEGAAGLSELEEDRDASTRSGPSRALLVALAMLAVSAGVAVTFIDWNAGGPAAVDVRASKEVGESISTLAAHDQDSWDLGIFICDGDGCDSASSTQTARLEERLATDPRVSRVAFESATSLSERASRSMQNDETVSKLLHPEVFADVYHVDLNDADEVEAVAAAYRAHAAAEQVVTYADSEPARELLEDLVDKSSLVTMAYPPEHGVSVFVCDVVGCDVAITSEQRDALESALRSDELVTHVEYESKAEAYANFRYQYQTYPDIVEGVAEDALPAAFRLHTHPDDAERVRSRYADWPGVEEVVTKSSSNWERNHPHALRALRALLRPASR